MEINEILSDVGLWLTTKYRIANSKITRLFERFDSIEDIYLSKSFNNIYGISERAQGKYR